MREQSLVGDVSGFSLCEKAKQKAFVVFSFSRRYLFNLFSSKKQISYHWSVDLASYSADSRDWVGGVKVEASLSGLVSRDGGTGSGKIKENQV